MSRSPYGPAYLLQQLQVVILPVSLGQQSCDIHHWNMHANLIHKGNTQKSIENKDANTLTHLDSSECDFCIGFMSL